MAKAVSHSHDVPTTSPLPPVSVSTHTHTHTHTFPWSSSVLSPKEWHMIGPSQGLANHGPRPNLTAPFFFVCPTNSNGFVVVVVVV